MPSLPLFWYNTMCVCVCMHVCLPPPRPLLSPFGSRPEEEEATVATEATDPPHPTAPISNGRVTGMGEGGGASLSENVFVLPPPPLDPRSFVRSVDLVRGGSPSVAAAAEVGLLVRATLFPPSPISPALDSLLSSSLGLILLCDGGGGGAQPSTA